MDDRGDEPSRAGLVERQGLSHADFARYVSYIGSEVSRELATLVGGMWNPDYCEADAARQAVDFCERMRGRIEHIEERAKAPLLDERG